MIIRFIIVLCCLSAGVARAAIGLDELAEALERHAAKDHIAAFARTDLTNALAGWMATGLEVTQGQSVTFFGDGEIDAGIGNPLYARHAVWYRVGAKGEAWNLASNADTIVAGASGELFLAIRPLGVYWSDRHGSFDPALLAQEPVAVDLSVVSIAWKGEAAPGIRALYTAGVARAPTALNNIGKAEQLPPGFDYLWYLGRSHVWKSWSDDQHRGIRASTTDDVGIVRKPVDIALSDATEVSFQWRYRALPALGPETEAGFHDYLSIAIEFDNGQDITWMWAKHIDADQSFRCPLDWWDQRETHIVLQSGATGLDEWHTHTRPLKADYLDAVGGDVPKRIVGVWFIANSLFGRQLGEAAFADVTIKDGDTRVSVF